MGDRDEVGLLAMAANLFQLLKGGLIQPSQWEASRGYLVTLFPQIPAALVAKERGGFFDSLAGALLDFEERFHLARQWSNRFTSDGEPASPQVARDFLRNYISLFANFPRLEHDVLCREIRMRALGLNDIEIHHPLAGDHYFFYMTLEGGGQIKLGGETIPLRPHGFAFLPPTCNCVVARDPDCELWNFYSGQFRLKSFWIDLVDWVSDFTRPQVLELAKDIASIQQGILRQVVQAKMSPGVTSERLAANLIEQLLIRTVFSVGSDAPRIDARIARVISHALRNLASPVDVEEVARLVHLSPSHFGSLFTCNMGLSFGQWREQARMEESARLLRHTGLSVGEIAMRVGFADQMYFSRRFHKLMSCSPRDYRLSARQEPTVAARDKGPRSD